METDHRGKNEICVGSTLNENQEQQRWVTRCFTLLPWAFKPTDSSGVIYDYVPHLSVSLYIIVLVYQVKECKFCLQVQKSVILTINVIGQVYKTETWAWNITQDMCKYLPCFWGHEIE